MTRPVFVDRYTHTAQCLELGALRRMVGEATRASEELAICHALGKAALNIDEARMVAHQHCTRSDDR